VAVWSEGSDLFKACTHVHTPNSWYCFHRKARGFERLVLQVGRGSVLPGPESGLDLTLEAFRFKDSISEDIARADLVISHAGAGSCLEALGARKPLLVVVNNKLMDNHQQELARQLHKESHLLYCTCRSVLVYNCRVDVLLQYLRTKLHIPDAGGRGCRGMQF
uniref:UDP-N-acetylglucosamine transferase subunit ALG13 n=1 Tax=Gadus morhua TaxID=8049 RepID=A0A8C5C513_GADMO